MITGADVAAEAEAEQGDESARVTIELTLAAGQRVAAHTTASMSAPSSRDACPCRKR
jgi:hypothetical protein